MSEKKALNIFTLISIFLTPFTVIAGIAIYITGYLWYFRDYPLDYLLYPIYLWVFCIAIAILGGENKEGRIKLILTATGTGFGWMWIVGFIGSIYFLITAIFMDGSWYEFLYSLIVTALAKSYAATHLGDANKMQL